MKNQQSELTNLLLNKLDELVRDQEQQQIQHQEFFQQQQLQWEAKVSNLTAQVQDLRKQLQTLSKSLQPLTEQLNSLATLSATLRDS